MFDQTESYRPAFVIVAAPLVLAVPLILMTMQRIASADTGNPASASVSGADSE